MPQIPLQALRRRGADGSAWWQASLFACVLLGSLLHHEIWRDEMQAWGLAQSSGSVAQMLFNMRYEGHPPGWHLLLFVLTRFTHNPIAMQFLNGAIMVAAMVLLLKYAPLPPLQKALAPWGYFFLFEYGTISRSYGLGVLLLFVLAALFPLRWKKPLLCTAVLCLLMQTSLYGMLLALAWIAMLAVEAWQLKARRDEVHEPLRVLPPPWRAALMCAMLGCSALFFVRQVVPPADNQIYSEWTTRFEPRRAVFVLGTAWNSTVPIPALRPQFWESNILGGSFERDFKSKSPSPTVSYAKAVLGIAIVALAAWGWRKHPAGVFYSLAVASIFAFNYLKVAGEMRHQGHLFLALLVAYWLWLLPDANTSNGSTDSGFSRAVPVLATLVLALHTFAAVFAVAVDWRFAFSRSGEAADFIRARGWASAPMVGHTPEVCSPIAIRLGREMYYPAAKRHGSYILWNTDRTPLRNDEVLARAARLDAQLSRPVLLILNSPLATTGQIERQRFTIVQAAAFSPAIRGDEIYFLYWLRPLKRPETQVASSTAKQP
jgi:hypothetical protein